MFSQSINSLFWEEISVCALVCLHYVMGTYDKSEIHNSFANYDGNSFVLVALTRLIVSEPKY